ncbi:MAG: hypothetical protein ACI854_001440 [Arenicella sp.]
MHSSTCRANTQRPTEFVEKNYSCVAQAHQQNQSQRSELDTPESHKTELLKNSYVIIGHRFGTAIVLSALDDLLLNDLIATTASLSDSITACNKINRFADALI